MTIHPSQFEIHPSSGVPIFRQVIDQVHAFIAGRHLQPGDMLPSVRDMAVHLGVNPMTISKAYAKLEADGTLERLRGKGMAIAQPASQPNLTDRLHDLKAALHPAIIRARQLGLSDKQILESLHKLLKELPQ